MSLAYAPNESNRTSARVVEEVRATMARFGLHQAELAALLGVSQGHASRKLRSVTPFTLDEVDLLADWFQTTPAYLMGHASEPRPSRPERGPHLYTARDSNPEPAD